MGPPRRAVRCRDVTGRPGPAVTSRSLAERRSDDSQRPGPHERDGTDSPRPRGSTSAPSGRLEQRRGLGQSPERRRGCGLNYAAKLRRRLSTHPHIFGGISPRFEVPGGVCCPAETAQWRPGLPAAALASPSSPMIIFYCYLRTIEIYLKPLFGGERVKPAHNGVNPPAHSLPQEGGRGPAAAAHGIVPLLPQNKCCRDRVPRAESRQRYRDYFYALSPTYALVRV